MRVVNLSRRPFLNRRPVQRVAILLWVIGGLLLAANTWLFADYFSGTSKNRQRLAELNAEIDAVETEFDRLGQRLSQLSLGDRNQRAVYLNDLIDQRTFPWSRLFDDLEDALSDDVYLTLVSPSVQEEEEPRARSRSTSRRLTPREARERARQRRSSGGSSASGTSGPAALPTPETANVAEESDFALVKLQLKGAARSEDALLDFLDALYQNESFVDPDLFTEVTNVEQRSVGFTIQTFYLLPRRVAAEQPADDTDMAAGTGTTEAADTEEGETQANAQGAPGNSDRRAPSGSAGRPANGSGAEGEIGAASRRRPAQASGGSSSQANVRADGADAGQAAGERDDEASARDPRVRRPGTSTDRRRLDEIRSRVDSLDDSSRNRSSQNGRDLQDASDEPELTEPAASATPRLRRQGSLELPTLPFGIPSIHPAAPNEFEEARA